MNQVFVIMVIAKSCHDDGDDDDDGACSVPQYSRVTV